MTKKFFALGLKGMLGLSLGFALAVSVGCTVQQDPTKGQPDWVREGGLPPDVKPPVVEKPKDGIGPDDFKIDSVDNFSFVEEVDNQSFEIGSRILIADAEAKLTVVNLADFPGAVFKYAGKDPSLPVGPTNPEDQSKGTLSWKPARGTVKNGYKSVQELIVRLDKTNAPLTSNEQKIKVFILRADSAPTIVQVEALDQMPAIVEGSFREFRVVVEDFDADDVDGARPLLMVVPNSSFTPSLSLAQFVSVDSLPKRDQFNPARWIFRARVDLANKEITRKRDLFKFGLQVTNQFGKSSGVKPVNALIETSTQKPQLSWPTDATYLPEFFIGQENVVSFTVFDPSSVTYGVAESTLTANWVTKVDQLPGAANALCSAQRVTGTLVCTLRWKPAAGTGIPGVVQFKLDATAVSQSSGVAATQSFNFNIKVSPSNNPPPAPSPVPTPAPTPDPGPSPVPNPTATPPPAPTPTPIIVHGVSSTAGFFNQMLRSVGGR